MNFKAITINASVAVAVVANGTLTISSAHAAGLTGKLELGWIGEVNTTAIDFYYSQNDPGTGSYAGTGLVQITGGSGAFAALAPVVNPLTLNTATINGRILDLNSVPSGPISNFISFLDPASANTYNFSLTSFKFNALLNKFEFDGIFADGTKGVGELTSQFLGAGDPHSYSATITAVPTPALLPGLIGLGIGVLRKRKAEATEAVTSEA